MKSILLLLSSLLLLVDVSQSDDAMSLTNQQTCSQEANCTNDQTDEQAEAALISFLHLKLDIHQVSSGNSCTADDFDKKDLDLVILGAYGFTGVLSSEYLGQGHPDSPRWAIAGRNEQELQALFDRLSHKPQKMLHVDLHDTTSLLEMTRLTKVVLTYAGPYEQYGGEALIRAALDGCSHYVDISGENSWKQMMLSKYGSLAQTRGVTLVQSAGFDSLPADLMGTLAAETFTSVQNRPPEKIDVRYTKVNGGISGGTLAAGVYTSQHHSPIEDPYFLVPWWPTQAKVDTSLDGLHHGYESFYVTPVSTTFSGAIDGPVLRRSMALAFPDNGIQVAVGQSPDVALNAAAFFNDPRMLTDPMPSNLKPGEGPPRWIMEDGSFAGYSVATGTGTGDSQPACIVLQAKGDPGYMATAKMSTELALGLALQPREADKHGYMTPSSAIGASKLRERLEKAESGQFMTFSDRCS